jgi:hypothetical protein
MPTSKLIDNQVMSKLSIYSVSRFNYGILDDSGNILVKNFFEIRESGKVGYFIAKKDFGDRYGVINDKGKWIIKPDYTEIKETNDSLIWIVSKSKLYGLIDEKGNELLPFKYLKISIGNEDGLYFCNLRNNIVIFNAVNNIDKKTNYQELAPDLLPNNYVVKKTGKWGIVDLNDTVYLDLKYDNYYGNNSKYHIFEKSRKILLVSNYKEIVELKGHKFHQIVDNYLVTRINNNFSVLNFETLEKKEFPYSTLIYGDLARCFVYTEKKSFRIDGDDYYEATVYGLLDSKLNPKGAVEIPKFVTDFDGIQHFLLNKTKFKSLKNIDSLVVVDREKFLVSRGGYFDLFSSSFNILSKRIIKDENYDEDYDEDQAVVYTNEETIIDEDIQANKIVDNKPKKNSKKKKLLKQNKVDIEPLASNNEESNSGSLIRIMITALVLFVLYKTNPSPERFIGHAKRDYFNEYYSIGSNSSDAFVSSCTRIVQITGLMKPVEEAMWKEVCVECLRRTNFGLFSIYSVEMSGYNKTYIGVFGVFL